MHIGLILSGGQEIRLQRNVNVAPYLLDVQISNKFTISTYTISKIRQYCVCSLFSVDLKIS